MAFLNGGAVFRSPVPCIGAVVGAALLALAGCADPIEPAPMMDPPNVLYGAVEDDGFTVSAINLRTIDPQFLRQVVDTPTTISGEPGVLVVDPANRFLYLTLAGGKSMRYGIGVGRGVRLVGRGRHQGQAALAEVVPAEGDGRARSEGPPLRQGHGWRTAQSARCAGALPLAGQQGHALPPARHQRPVEHRQGRLERLHPHVQSGHHRPLRACAARDEGDRAAPQRIEADALVTEIVDPGRPKCHRRSSARR